MHGIIAFIHTHTFIHTLIIWIKVIFQVLFIIFTLITVIGSQVALPESAYRGRPQPDAYPEEEERLPMESKRISM
jgi:hypothetical protein